MKRINAHFEIVYKIEEVYPGIYSGNITIDRPRKNYGYVLRDFEPITIDTTISGNQLSYSLPQKRHECIDAVLDSIKLKDILPEEKDGTEYSGKIRKIINPNKWIGEYLKNMKWNFNYSSKGGIRDDY